MPESLDLCVRELMDTVPQIMRAIRSEMRLGRGANISIPQFRVLRFIQRNPDLSLSDLASHMGITPPSVSKLVDGLVKQELINRKESTSDRRRVTLALTQAGEALVDLSRTNAQASLAKTLSCLSDDETDAVLRAMELLRPLFTLQESPQVKE